jgi:hypothetical protein
MEKQEGVINVYCFDIVNVFSRSAQQSRPVRFGLGFSKYNKVFND